MIDAVLFDWAGTITPYHEVDFLGCWTAAARVMAPDRAEELAAALLAAEHEAWPGQRETLVSTTTRELVRSVCTVDDATYALAAGAYRERWAPHCVSRPDAAAVLRALKARRLRTGLLSNTHWPRDWHEEALAADGLDELLDARLYSSELSPMKPHPSTFQALLDAVGSTARRAVFVGDRPHDDISGAQAMGMRTVWIRNAFVPSYDVTADATIDELSDLVGVIDGWRSLR
jgi:HAD superfamily hydrolase (TIGR01509 family)